MQFPAERPEFFDESFLYKVVDIFGIRAKGFKPHGVRLGARGNFDQRSQRLLQFGIGQNADRFEGNGPNRVHGDFVHKKTAIK